MQSRPGFSTITIALTVLSTTARAAEPIAPAAHPAPSVHSTAKGGTVPHSGPTATTPGGMFPVERRAALVRAATWPSKAARG